jgi:hypothetical protein
MNGALSYTARGTVAASAATGGTIAASAATGGTVAASAATGGTVAASAATLANEDQQLGRLLLYLLPLLLLRVHLYGYCCLGR